MSAPKEKVGKMPCRHCGTPVYVRRNPDNGTVSYFCDECDMSTFAKRGTRAHGEWLKACEGEPKPTPTKPAAAGGLNLGAL